MANKDGRIRANVTLGSQVQIVLKQDQKSGHLTKGVVEEVLTPGAKHPHGIKVRLRSGHIGRIKKILAKSRGVPVSKESHRTIKFSTPEAGKLRKFL